MIRRLSTLLLTLVAVASLVSVVCQAQSQSLLTRHVREATSNGQAQAIGRVPANQSMHLDVILALRHPAELENFLEELYDPSSKSYRQFLTVEEFTERFGPTQDQYDAVINFAKANGFTVGEDARNRLVVSMDGAVGNVEKAFHVELGLYQHPTEDRTFYAPDREPSVDLPFALWHVAGLDNFSIPKPALVRSNGKAKSNATVGSGPGASFLGSDMRAAYYGTGALNGAGQSVGLFELAGTDLADLNTYYTNVGQTLNVPITLQSVGGARTSCVEPSCDDTEQTLDMTQALGMAPGLSSLVMYIGNTETPIFNAMATASPLNANLSCSWYWSPADPGTLDPIFQEFASQGQNLFDASGDSGRYGSSRWPADDAYLVSVGGTDLETKSAGGPWASETAWADGGGGPSPNKIPIPSWQVATAAGCSNCSQTYRNVPDVSANSNFTFYVCADQTTCTANDYGGTSFAAPMWAGYLALANQQAVANGQPLLGFIDPAIYAIGLSASYTTDFHDIVGGSNGYSATPGYDLATGWGSPNGANLINALTGPAGPSFSLSANPTSLTINQGASGNSTITITPAGGFSGSVTLTASGLPSGVTAVFSPNPATTTSTLTLTASGSAATGTVTVTIGGTSGSLSASTTLSLTVQAPTQSFTLSALPTSVTIAKGGASGTSNITINPVNGFSGSVSLTATGLPKGVTAVFSPNPATTSSVLTLTASSTAKAGTVTVTIKGTSGSLSATTTISLTVNPLGSYTLTATPKTLSIAPGNSGTSTIAVVSTTGFDQEVNLAASGMPAGVTAGFSTNPTTSTSVLTITVSGSAAAGKSTITVTGTSGTKSHKVTIKLTVT